jgi:hypothetical protein
MKKSIRTDRVKAIRLAERRRRHELRKKRKVKSPYPFYNDGLDTQVAPHICAMFRRKKK